MLILGRVMATVLMIALLSVGANAGPSAYWRFEKGQVDTPVGSTFDQTGKMEAVAEGAPTLLSSNVPMAILPLTNAENHTSLAFSGGYLRVKSCPELDMQGTFTIEFWARFGGPRPDGEVLLSRGDPARGNWHIIYRADGSVRACIYGGADASFFDEESRLIPGVWYHLAATFDSKPDGKVLMRTYVNGQPRGSATGAMAQGPNGSDLFVGSFNDGKVPFHGSLDELRISPALLESQDMLIAGRKDIPERNAVRPKPVFVRAGTKISAQMRAKAGQAPILVEPDGYPFFYKYSTGQPVGCSAHEGTCDQGFDSALCGWGVAKGGSPAGYHFMVRPGGHYVVAVGFYDAAPGSRPQNVVIDGRMVDSVDPASDGKGQPFVRKYDAADDDRDGLLEVSVSQAADEVDYTAKMNVIWVFRGADSSDIDTSELCRGECPIPPAYYVRCGDEVEMRGHIGYPELTREARNKMLPMRPVPFALDPKWPQPVDPLNVTIRGDLADRISTYLDRWGFTGRDQKLVAGFLVDSGYEVAGRYIETLYMLGRLMKYDFSLDVPFDALLERQDKASKFPGSFVGGSPLRTAFIWSQGTVLSGLMGYHEMSGDPRALEAAGKLADWYQAYMDNGDLAAANYFASDSKFSRDGATIGHLCKGALEGLVWLYWRTNDRKYLDEAIRVAELNRQWGGVAWMVHGDLPQDRQQYEGWHIHASLTTVRGFPWLYAATGDRSYLDDAIAACDRVFERATWGTGGVLEQIPWIGTQFPGPNPDPHDETCQTSDELQLSYLLADFTGEGRFFDRAEQIYYNHISYMQMHNGDFTAFNRLPGPQRGGDAWFCCGWWGGKALYEAARHLYAVSPDAVYINDFMPSSVELKVGGRSVKIDTDADMPKNGNVRMTITPRGVARFLVNIRIPGWATLRGIRVNGTSVVAQIEKGYAVIDREWKPKDTIDVTFDLPLRVVLDPAWDTLPAAKVSVDGAAPAEARCVSIYQGPVIIAQFRVNHGCDLNWAYTGDHPDLFETLTTASDVIEGDGWQFDSGRCPDLTRVTNTPKGVLLEWQSSPQPGWTLKRTALVRTGVPVAIDYACELTAPSADALKSIKPARLCGVRMRTQGFVDYKKAILSVGGKKISFMDASEKTLPAGTVKLDNGYVQFAVTATKGEIIASDSAGCAALYSVPQAEGQALKASCSLKITGQSQWAGPVIRRKGR